MEFIGVFFYIYLNFQETIGKKYELSMGKLLKSSKNFNHDK